MGSTDDLGETWHITLVHGTFARNAAWTRPGSALREHIAAKLLPGRVVYHCFRWSGLPSHRARDRAAQRLRARLLKCVHHDETARHCVIAHSHGGNILCYALRDTPELVAQLDYIVTLSTPFLLMRSRNLSMFGMMSAFGSLIVAIIGIFLLAISLALGPSTPGEFFALWREVSVHEFSYKNWIVTLIGLSMFAAGSAVVSVVRRWKAWLDATLAMPRLTPERLLIVRSFADEATALLVAAQFFDILMTMFWGRSGAIDRALLASGTWLAGQVKQWSEGWVGIALFHLLGAWAKLFYVEIAVLLPVSCYFYWTQPDAYVAFFLGPYTPTVKNIWAVIALLGAPIVVVLAVLAAIVLLVLALGATVGLVVVAANICLSLIMLVVVPELGPLALIMAISAEPVPGVGIFRVLQIRPEHKIGTVETRFHSTTYADPAALDAITTFISGNRVEPGAPVQRVGAADNPSAVIQPSPQLETKHSPN